jgi:superfamily II DNA helicase RecQ
MESKNNIALENLMITFPLKDKQYETLRALYNRSDCISVLPTGYGKSLIFQMLPWVLMKDNGKPGIVIIVCPLTSIMQDQVMSLNEKGIRAAYMNIHGTEVYSFNNESSDDEVDSSPTKSVV